MTDLTRDAIPTVESRRALVPVELPAWGGGTLYVRPLSAQESTDLPEGLVAFVGRLLLQSVVFGDGTAVWSDEASALAYPAADLQPLVQAAMQANGLQKNAHEDRLGN